MITVNPNNLPLVDYNQLIPIQGNLKDLSKDNHDKLLRSFEVYNFFIPIFVWLNEGKYNLVDGHQRHRVLTKNHIKFDNTGTKVPCLIVEADSLNEAKEKLLMVSSQYGTITYEGWSEFTAELNEAELIEAVSFDALNFNKIAGTYEGEKGSLQDKFLVPPFSILDTKQGYWQTRKNTWRTQIEDNGESREKTLSGDGILSGINNGVSLLDPVLAEIAVKWFGIDGGLAFDPFAGDTVFGYVAASTGMRFVGTELRKEQADLNQKRVDKDKLPAKYICDDALNMDKHVKDETIDLVFSCPPYADLEVYSDLPNDLSTMSHEDFYKVYATVLANTYKKLKPNRFAVITTSEVRNKAGQYISLVPKTIEIMQSAGYTYYNELILVNSVGTLPQRVGRSMRNRKVGRQHQNVLVFYKGNTKDIAKHFKPIDFTEALEGVEDVTDSI